MHIKIWIVTIFIMFSSGVKAWTWPKFSQQVLETKVLPGNKRLPAENFRKEPSPGSMLPKDFYSGELAEGSDCHKAYVRMPELCSLASQRSRMHLATVLTNCHLEAAGRKPIPWDFDFGLQYASREDADLVMHYLPLVGNICENSGHGYDLALFRMQVNNDMKLWNSIDVLQDAISKAETVNKETEILNQRFETYLESASRQSKQVLNLTGKMRDILGRSKDEFSLEKQMTAEMRKSMRILAEHNDNMTASMLTTVKQAHGHIDSINEKVNMLEEHAQLLRNHTRLQDELREHVILLAMCPNKTEMSIVQKLTIHGMQRKDRLIHLSNRLFTTTLYAAIITPLRVTAVSIWTLLAGFWFNDAHILTLSLRAGVTIIGLMISYRALLIIGKVADVGRHLAESVATVVTSSFRSQQPVRNTPPQCYSPHSARLHLSSSPRLEDTQTGTEELLHAIIAKFDDTLKNRLRSIVSKRNKENAANASEILSKLANMERAWDDTLLPGIIRIEKRQIHIYNTLTSKITRKLDNAKSDRDDDGGDCMQGGEIHPSVAATRKCRGRLIRAEHTITPQRRSESGKSSDAIYVSHAMRTVVPRYAESQTSSNTDRRRASVSVPTSTSRALRAKRRRGD